MDWNFFHPWLGRVVLNWFLMSSLPPRILCQPCKEEQNSENHSDVLYTQRADKKWILRITTFLYILCSILFDYLLCSDVWFQGLSGGSERCFLSDKIYLYERKLPNEPIFQSWIFGRCLCHQYLIQLKVLLLNSFIDFFGNPLDAGSAK